jgi:hypothetical protein
LYCQIGKIPFNILKGTALISIVARRVLLLPSVAQ